MAGLNGKSYHERGHDIDAISANILNPFVHRLELDTTYDKLKVSLFAIDGACAIRLFFCQGRGETLEVRGT